jgi:formylglycine-generating enzyme required for sulfatase activity
MTNKITVMKDQQSMKTMNTVCAETPNPVTAVEQRNANSPRPQCLRLIRWAILLLCLWLREAAAQPVLSVPQMYAGLSLTGAIGQTYEIQATTNLAATNAWVTLTNLVLLESPWFFLDKQSPDFPQRFYRAACGTNPTPPGMVLIPAGSFMMGDTFVEGDWDETPSHPLWISSFNMDRFEVTKAFWDEVYQWAITNGYSFDNRGSGKGPSHPVHSINWNDAVKWCNARSEREGRVPAYYTDASQTNVYRSTNSVIYDLQNSFVKWNAGYRLPTEAEWEKAARSGTPNLRFPWGDTISFSRANYTSSYWYEVDLNATNGFHPTFATGGYPYTSPVGYFAENTLGLYDMAGNVWEYCWDWYDSSYYSQSPGTDPQGSSPYPGQGGRIVRGGSWDSNGKACRSASRWMGYTGGYAIGFRTVLP